MTHLSLAMHECTALLNDERQFIIFSYMNQHFLFNFIQCKRCEYRSTQGEHMKNHIRTHTGKKPFKGYTAGQESSSLGFCGRFSAANTRPLLAGQFERGGV